MTEQIVSLINEQLKKATSDCFEITLVITSIFLLLNPTLRVKPGLKVVLTGTANTHTHTHRKLDDLTSLCV